MSASTLKRNQLGVATRRGIPSEIEDARRELAATNIEQYIERIVASSPPLTDEQRNRIASLLAPSVGASA